MRKTRSVAIGLLAVILSATGCTTVHGKKADDKTTSAPPSVSANLPSAEPAPLPAESAPPKPPRPTDLKPTPIQDPCGMMSEERAREITGNRQLSFGDRKYYYMPDRLRRANEPASWSCPYRLHQHKPIEGLMIDTYDTGSIAQARRKYDEVVAYHTHEKYYGKTPYHTVKSPSGLNIKRSERSALLGFRPENTTDGTTLYGGVVVLSRDTVVKIEWTTKDLGVLKALAEEVTYTTGIAGK